MKIQISLAATSTSAANPAVLQRFIDSWTARLDRMKGKPKTERRLFNINVAKRRISELKTKLKLAKKDATKKKAAPAKKSADAPAKKPLTHKQAQKAFDGLNKQLDKVFSELDEQVRRSNASWKTNDNHDVNGKLVALNRKKKELQAKQLAAYDVLKGHEIRAKAKKDGVDPERAVLEHHLKEAAIELGRWKKSSSKNDRAKGARLQKIHDAAQRKLDRYDAAAKKAAKKTKK